MEISFAEQKGNSNSTIVEKKQEIDTTKFTNISQQIVEFSELTKFALENCTLESKKVCELIEQLAEKKSLRQLSLAGTPIYLSGFLSVIELLKTNPLLESLNVANTKLLQEESTFTVLFAKSSSEVVQAFKLLAQAAYGKGRRMKRLNFSQNSISTQEFKLLSNFFLFYPSLTSLRLREMKIDREMGIALALIVNQIPALRILDVQGNPLGATKAEDSTFLHKLNNPNLENIDVSNCEIWSGPREGKQHTSSSRIPIQGMSIGNSGKQEHLYLTEFLLRHNKLKTVNFANNPLSVLGFEEIFLALKHHPSLENVNISGNEYSTGRKIGQYFLSINPFTDFITQSQLSLKENHSLRSLHLNSVAIDDKGIEKLVKQLEGNYSITELSLLHNKFGEKGAKALFALVNNSALRVLLIDPSIPEYKELQEELTLINKDYEQLEKWMGPGVTEDDDEEEEKWENRTYFHPFVGDMQEVKDSVIASSLFSGNSSYERQFLSQFFRNDPAVAQFLENNQPALNKLVESLYQVPKLDGSKKPEQPITVTEELQKLEEECVQIEAKKKELKQLHENIKQLEINKTGEESKESERKDLLSVREKLNQQAKKAQRDKEVQELREQLQVVMRRQDLLEGEQIAKQARKKSVEELKNTPNGFLCYQTVCNKIEELFISAKAAAGGFAQPTKGNMHTAGTVIELCGKALSLFPVAGNVIGAVAQGVSSGMDKLDETRQTNLAKSISDLATLQEVEKEAQKMAACLTKIFQPQLAKMREPGDLKQRANAKMEKAKQVVAKERKLSDAQLFAEYAILRFYEAAINQRLEPNRLLSVQFEELIFAMKTKKKQFNRIFSVIGTNTILTKDETEWVLEEIYTKVGVQDADGKLYSGKNSNVAKYGYCFGDARMIQQRSLVEQTLALEKVGVIPNQDKTVEEKKLELVARYTGTIEELRKALSEERKKREDVERRMISLEDRLLKLEMKK